MYVIRLNDTKRNVVFESDQYKSKCCIPGEHFCTTYLTDNKTTLYNVCFRNKHKTVRGKGKLLVFTFFVLNGKGKLLVYTFFVLYGKGKL